METTPSELLNRAQAGDVDAQIAAGLTFEGRNETRRARAWFAAAARAGSLPALRMLAVNLLSCEPVIERDGVEMMRAAAAGGDGEAEHICGMIAAQDAALDRRWTIALAHVGRAAERGLPLAQEALQLLANGFAAEGGQNPQWGDFAARLDAESFVRLRQPARTLSESPSIVMFEGFATPAICDWLIERARPKIQRAQVYDPSLGRGGQVRQFRTNSSADFGVAHCDLVLMLIRNRIANSASLPLDSLESPSILHYLPGQEYAPHYDFLDPAVPGFAQEIAAKGQRVATFLVCLNDDYEGGETEFPLLGLSFKGRRGDALLFWNVNQQGAADPRTRHAGTPPSIGEKWVLSQWLRKRPPQYL